MSELFPVVLGMLFGTAIWQRSSGRKALLSSVAAVAVSGFVSTLLSGEFGVNPLYLMLDLGEAAFGLALGMAVAQCVLARVRQEALRSVSTN